MRFENVVRDAKVTRIELWDKSDGSGQFVKVNLDGQASFILDPTDPIIPKINVGCTFDATFASKTETEGQASGAAVTYTNLNWVKIIPSTVKPGEVDKEIEALQTVTKLEDLPKRFAGDREKTTAADKTGDAVGKV